MPYIIPVCETGNSLFNTVALNGSFALAHIIMRMMMVEYGEFIEYLLARQN
jgi:hypothetical protein